MGTIDALLVDLESNTLNANVIKDMVLNQLILDKVIDEKEYEEYKENWRVLLYKKSWFQKLTSKDKKNGWYYKFIKFNHQEKESITIS